MSMEFVRLCRHLAATPWGLRRAFPAPALAAIEAAIASSEARHGGEIRFAVEAALPPAAVLRGQTARERAIEVFSLLRVWDTEANNGILIYLLLADRDVEIVADRGLQAGIGNAEWEEVCRRMEAVLRRGAFGEAVLAGIETATRLLAEHCPKKGTGPGNQLPDRPAVF